MRRATLALTAGLALSVAIEARGADQVTVRGAYYREPSTRVIQPVVEVQKDLPGGYQISARYLVDAITSASAAAGTAVDSIFTEIRNEAELRVQKNWDRSSLMLGYRYSAESDYWSHVLGGAVAGRFWQDTATVALSLSVSLDTMSSRGRTPFCATPPSTSCPLNSYFAGLSYTQVISPVSITQFNVESAYLSGFQGNLYRLVPSLGYEIPPNRRLRNALAWRYAIYSPRTSTGFQFHYRFYWDLYPGNAQTPDDPWLIRAHTIEVRLYHKLSRNLEARLLFREHLQNHADFWCDTNANPACYQSSMVSPPYFSTDPKLGGLHTEYPEVKLLWDAERLRGVPFLGWFAAGTFEIGYGYYIQSDAFGNAHVLQAGYTMPY